MVFQAKTQAHFFSLIATFRPAAKSDAEKTEEAPAVAAAEVIELSDNDDGDGGDGIDAAIVPPVDVEDALGGNNSIEHFLA